jgi:hypothetical protein
MKNLMGMSEIERLSQSRTSSKGSLPRRRRTSRSVSPETYSKTMYGLLSWNP